MQNPYENPHASLIALFMDAIVEADQSDTATKGRSGLDIIHRYRILRNKVDADPFGVGMLIKMKAVPLGMDVEENFTK